MKDWDLDERKWVTTVAVVLVVAAGISLAGLIGLIVRFPAREEPAPPTITVYYICETNERYGNSTFIVGLEVPLYGPWPTSFSMTDFESGFSVRCRNWEGR